MAVIAVALKIGSIAAPRGYGIDADDLRVRVEAELGALLAREPLRAVPTDGTAIELPGGTVAASSLASPSSTAHAIACHVHRTLMSREIGS